MTGMKTLTPHGVSDYIPDEAEAQKQISDKIAAVFEAHHYKKIRTPTIEYDDILSVGLGESLKKRSIRFFNPQGQLVLLRPDHTTPIARLVASRLSQEPLPLRLYYQAPVFRNPGPHQHQNMEIMQSGLELIGSKDVSADIEVLTLCITALKTLGFEEFTVDVGHVNFVNKLTGQEKDALLEGDYVTYGHIPPRGGVELVNHDSYLLALYNGLKKNGLESYIQFNTGLIKDLQYYTGLIFECYVKGIRQSVGSGGRYDNVIAKFGFDCPAVGFALDTSLLSTHTLEKP